MDHFITIILQTAFINNLLLIGFFVVFGVVFWAASKNPKSNIDWEDLLVDPASKRVSLDKLGQFWGIAISSWMMIYLTQMTAAYSILPMLFPAYLAYLAGVYTFGRWLKSKDAATNADRSAASDAEDKEPK
jgi:hypothetical protein